MANNLLTISKVTPEALMVLENELTFTRGVDRMYDDQFAQDGAKIGYTVNLRKPARFLGGAGPALNIEDFNETYVPLTLTTQWEVATTFTTADLTMSLDMFSDRVLRPKIAAIANKIDADGLTMAKNSTGNIVGTPGTPASAYLTYLNAGAYLSAEGAPVGDRSVVIEPFTSAAVVDGLKGLFTPADKIGEQYKRGRMGRDSAGMDWNVDQNVVSQTFGAWAGASASTFTMNAANQGLASGWASSSTLNVTTGASLTLNQGDVIQIAGVYAVNPQNRSAYGSNKLRSFVVQSTTTLNGAGTLTVSPALIYGGQFQNVTATPASNATITPYSVGVSGSGTVSPQNILYHRDAFAFACADLLLPPGVEASRASDKESGLSIRVVRQYTINNDSIPTRLDILYGWAPKYPELACRIAS